ncbi:hypothetical protein IQ283_02330 [Alkalihalobacillus hwajinpoensis]|uniref:hypothetical protein n=1 Tax=Guptibacillus hwajinpoensis TaxID=208199 RepID=UPI00188319DC|nr:hypothetical protein [Pseudalkalibacillus hwajinpoensis]MBF0705428.1 hypothetical protein [Pseudalkalibacillus hwajinpoensis]
MKKSGLLIFLFFILVACSIEEKTDSNPENTKTANTEEENSSTSETTELSNQNSEEVDSEEISPQEIQSIIESGFDLPHGDAESVKKVDFHGDGIPEFVTIMQGPEYDLLTVYEYDLENKKWIAVYEDESHENYGGVESLNILETANMLDDQKKEQVVIGFNSGSGAFLSFYVLCEVDSGIEKVLSKFDGDYSQGSIAVKGGALIVMSEAEEVERFSNLDFQVSDNHAGGGSRHEENILTIDTASALINEFYVAVVSGNYENAYDLIGEPWRNQMSYDSFSTGYIDTASLKFSIDNASNQSRNEILVIGTVEAVNKGTETTQLFEVQYVVSMQEGELKIKEGRGKEIANKSDKKVTTQTLNPEDDWTFGEWEAATFNEKVVKIARTWEEHVYQNPGAAKADTVLVSTALYIEDNYTTLKQSVDSIEELIIGSYLASDVSSYDPEEKCLLEMEGACGFE